MSVPSGCLVVQSTAPHVSQLLLPSSTFDISISGDTWGQLTGRGRSGACRLGHHHVLLCNGTALGWSCNLFMAPKVSPEYIQVSAMMQAKQCSAPHRVFLTAVEIVAGFPAGLTLKTPIAGTRTNPSFDNRRALSCLTHQRSLLVGFHQTPSWLGCDASCVASSTMSEENPHQPCCS